MTIIEEKAIDAYQWWRYHLDKGKKDFEITITDDEQRREFTKMLKRHNHRYRKRDKSYYL